MKQWIYWLAIALLPACSSIPGTQLAQTLPKGASQQTGGISFGLFKGPKDDFILPDVPYPMAQVNFQKRTGLSEHLDFGYRASIPYMLTPFVGTDIKYQFVDTDHFNMAIDLGVDAFIFAPVPFFSAQLLVDRPVEDKTYYAGLGGMTISENIDGPDTGVFVFAGIKRNDKWYEVKVMSNDLDSKNETTVTFTYGVKLKDSFLSWLP